MVFPTPVGPVNIRQAMGRFSSRIPEYPRRRASATAATAFGWPTTRSDRYSSSFRSRWRSLAVRRPTGIPVRADTAQATSAPVTARGLLFSPVWDTIFCILSRSSAARSKRLSFTAS